MQEFQFSIFTTRDPLCEEYYDISPYVYCANNPMRYVDPDGRKIVVGSFWGRVAAFFGADNFESQVQTQIEQLKETDEDVKNMIEDMEDSELEVKIVPTNNRKETSKNATEKNYPNAEVKQGSTIYYDVNSKSNHLGPRPPIIGLAHELGHADDYINGRGVNWNKKETTKEKKDAKQQAENHAIEIENKVRKAMGEPLRPLDYFK